MDLARAKQAAIDQWTADPCGPATSHSPGTAEYAEEIVVAGPRFSVQCE